jgi:hypothetical protein
VLERFVDGTVSDDVFHAAVWAAHSIAETGHYENTPQHHAAWAVHYAVWTNTSGVYEALYSALQVVSIADKVNIRNEQLAQRSTLLDILGNPFRPATIDPAWLTYAVTDLAQVIYGERAFDRMPILADALEEAGCTNEEILAHCRSGGEHVRGCWVVDLLLEKE